MLQFIRDRATGWIAWGIVILICIPFALWGIYDYLSPNPTVAVVTVNGTELSYRQFQQAYQRHRARLQALLGTNFDVRQFDESLLRDQSLESMIQDELLVQSGFSDGLRISDEQLARAIHVQTPFQRDGEFDQELYDRWLRTQGYSPGGFEFDLRRSLLTEQILSGVGGSEIVTDWEKSQLLTLAGQTRTYLELTLPTARYVNTEISEADIESYFNEHGANLITPEKVQVEYVEISRDAIAEEIEASEEELRAHYDSTKLNYVQPERREASHILLRVANDADEAGVDAVLERANALKQRLAAGEDFAALAKEVSEDPGSAKRGGELGFFESGDMVPALEEAAFALDVGGLSEAVRSGFGFHLIKLTAIEAGRTKTFEEARSDVLAEYQTAQAEQLYYERFEDLDTRAFEVPDTLEVVAEELGLTIQSIDDLTRDGSLANVIGSDPQVLEAVFSDDVLEARENSAAIALPDRRAVVVRVADYQPSRPQSLAEARGLIVIQLTEERARSGAKEEGEAVLEQLLGTEDRNAISETLGIEWVQRSEVTREQGTVEPSVLKAVYALPRPPVGDVTYTSVSTQSGDYVLIALTEVTDGDPDQMSPDRRQQLENELVNDYARFAFDVFVQVLREEADVVIDERSLER